MKVRLWTEEILPPPHNFSLKGKWDVIFWVGIYRKLQWVSLTNTYLLNQHQD